MRYLILFLVLVSPLFGIDKNLFDAYLKQPAPQWMTDQIEEDLAPFTEELSVTSLDDLFESLGNVFLLTRVRVYNGEMSIQYSKGSKDHAVTPWIIEGLQKLHALIALPNVDFVFSSSDALIHQLRRWPDPRYPLNLLERKLPIFAESKEHETAILMPDRWALKGYIAEKTEMMEGSLYSTWEQKMPLLFFRGSDTCRDPGVNWSKWDEAPRVRFVRFSLRYPHLADARFYLRLHNPSKQDAAQREGMITQDWFPLRDHPQYKYLVDLDGNCASCPRTAAIFHSNSVIFKEVTPSRQWWYRNLAPFDHYIPFESDLSDLMERLKWAKSHDQECQKISESGRKLVQDVLSEERIYEYFYRLINAYSERQRVVY